MNIVTIVNNPYTNISNVSFDLIDSNNTDLKIYGNIIILNKSIDLLGNNIIPLIVLDVISNNGNIIYNTHTVPYGCDIFNLGYINSFSISIINYQRFFELSSVKEFKLYTIFKKNNI